MCHGVPDMFRRETLRLLGCCGSATRRREVPGTTCLRSVAVSSPPSLARLIAPVESGGIPGTLIRVDVEAPKPETDHVRELEGMALAPGDRPLREGRGLLGHDPSNSSFPVRTFSVTATSDIPTLDLFCTSQTIR